MESQDIQIGPCFSCSKRPAGDHWTQLGARPKALVSSTPCEAEPWIVARGNKRCRRRSSRHPSQWDLKLDNMFSTLDEVEGPSLASCCHPPSQSRIKVAWGPWL
ncbi:hypothetical protein SKAU_G00136700 [Synaphobranchus kaupii]|uniref:Uncharacterized protein n=1 Tax=Synaphobranchus kaupii TaxID=118154 RepID=A0A9Q1FRR4_SYNKA|nr:hypothetical protein SKAU_G00136700 [Synaphobranchus kaupii]